MFTVFSAYSKIENNITQLTVHYAKGLSKILEVFVTQLLRDDFEIHKPVHLPMKVTKGDLVPHLEKLHKKVLGMPASKQDRFFYLLFHTKKTRKAKDRQI